MVKPTLVLFAIIISVVASPLVFCYPERPDFQKSPGKLCTTDDPDFEKKRYGGRVIYCKRNVAWETKAEILHTYGVPLRERDNYIIDHIIPLSIGGANSIENLWPQHLAVKERLGSIEDDLYEKVSSGSVSQKEAVIEVMFAKFGEGVSVNHLMFNQ